MAGHNVVEKSIHHRSSFSGTSSSSISGGHVGLAVGLSLGILILLVIVVTIVWRWKARNVRERKASQGKPSHPSNQSKSQEKSGHSHTLVGSGNLVPPSTGRRPGTKESHKRDSNTPFATMPEEEPRPSAAYDPWNSTHSRSASIDTNPTYPPTNRHSNRLAPREANRPSGDMSDLIGMLNSRRIDPLTGRPAPRRKGHSSFDDLLAEDLGESFLPDMHPTPSTILSNENTNPAPRIPSMQAASPMGEIPVPTIATPILPTPPTSTSTPPVIPSPPPIAIPNSSQSRSPPTPQKPKPSLFARGISASPAVYAPVSRTRSVSSTRAGVHSPSSSRDLQRQPSLSTNSNSDPLNAVPRP